MARSKLPRNVKPGSSDDPADRRGNRKDPTYLKSPLYVDACWEWHESLSEDWQDFVTYVIDAFTNWADEYAKRWAVRLPPAPRRPQACERFVALRNVGDDADADTWFCIASSIWRVISAWTGGEASGVMH
jgi:hypothetical protein